MNHTGSTPAQQFISVTEYSDSDDKDSLMPLLIYPEEPDNKEFLSKPPSVEPAPDP